MGRSASRRCCEWRGSEHDASNVASGNGSARISPVSTSTLSRHLDRRISQGHISSVAGLVVVLHRSTPVTRPAFSRLATAVKTAPRPQPMSSTLRRRADAARRARRPDLELAATGGVEKAGRVSEKECAVPSHHHAPGGWPGSGGKSATAQALAKHREHDQRVGRVVAVIAVRSMGLLEFYGETVGLRPVNRRVRMRRRRQRATP